MTPSVVASPDYVCDNLTLGRVTMEAKKMLRSGCSKLWKRWRSWRVFPLAFLIVLIGTGAAGQAPAPVFDVVSVKPHDPKMPTPLPKCENGRLSSLGWPMYSLITDAYDLKFPQRKEMEQQLPNWATTPSGYYDIEAKSESLVSGNQCWAMLGPVLEDRFKLRMHWTTKEGYFYELVIAPGGHKMEKVPGTATELGVFYKINGTQLRRGPGVPTWVGLSMASLASIMASTTPERLGVVDKTGLEGLYKIDLAYSTDPFEYSDPDLLTALQKQLGLKLEKRKGTVRSFVLDRLERPTPN